MNEELTKEVLEAMTKCNLDCTLCGANAVCAKYDWQDTIQTLATTLLEERAKPKAWDGAPDDAVQAQITWITKYGFSGLKTYTRELPKTRARQIAEETYVNMEDFTHEDFIDALESALNKYAEELEGKE